jgi:hypothetical protein
MLCHLCLCSVGFRCEEMTGFRRSLSHHLPVIFSESRKMQKCRFVFVFVFCYLLPCLVILLSEIAALCPLGFACLSCMSTQPERIVSGHLPSSETMRCSPWSPSIHVCPSVEVVLILTHLSSDPFLRILLIMLPACKPMYLQEMHPSMGYWPQRYFLSHLALVGDPSCIIEHKYSDWSVLWIFKPHWQKCLKMLASIALWKSVAILSDVLDHKMWAANCFLRTALLHSCFCLLPSPTKPCMSSVLPAEGRVGSLDVGQFSWSCCDLFWVVDTTRKHAAALLLNAAPPNKIYAKIRKDLQCLRKWNRVKKPDIKLLRVWIQFCICSFFPIVLRMELRALSLEAQSTTELYPSPLGISFVLFGAFCLFVCLFVCLF